MAANTDYIPTNDAEFESWMANFVTVLTPNLSLFKMETTDIADLLSAQGTFTTALTNQVSKQAAAKAAVATKKTSRETLEELLRPLVRQINNNEEMTASLREQLGLNSRNGSRTRQSAGEEVPGLYLETKPGQVIVHFGTDPTNELRNGKPAWALGCSIYRKKTGETDFSLIAFDTASPYVDTITGTATNVTYKVAYRGRHEEEHGPSSTEQTIAAGE
jgi:hypothetical protein